MFQNSESLQEWQDGYLGQEHLSGEPEKPGAKTLMKYKVRNQIIELVETIKVNNLPAEFIAEFEAKTMTNTMRVSFIALDENTTQYQSEVEYTAFRGFIPKLMGLFFKGIFKKQTQKWMEQFRDFAERTYHSDYSV